MQIDKHRKTGKRSPSSDAAPELPRATEAERVVVGALLVGNSNRQCALTKLTPEHFFDPQLRRVYSRLRAMHDEGKTMDLPTTVDEL